MSRQESHSESSSHSTKTQPKEHTHTFRHLTDKLFGHKEELNAHGTRVEPAHHNKELLQPQLHEQRLAEPHLNKDFSKLSLAEGAVAAEPIVHRQMFQPVVETHVRPTLLEQTTRTEKVVEVQPIIHRMVTEPEVHIIEKHVYETVPVTGPRTITKQAIVEETVKPRILEEIQPVVHRDVPAPYIKHVEKHINEQISLPATHSKEVLSEHRELAAEEAIKSGFIAPIAPIPVMAPVVRSHREAAIVETRLGAQVVEETIRPEIITEIQPIIHREVDAPEVHVIEKHTHESVPLAGPHHITKRAIIEESVRPRIIEEIQPVIHREVPVAVLEHVEQHTTEEIVAPVLNTREVLTEKHVAAPVALLSEKDIVAPAMPIIHSHKDAASLSSHTRDTIVETTARPEKIIEVQPIIHREVDAPEIHVVEKHLYEKVPTVGPAVITKQAIVEETVVPKVVEEIQPVLHREVPVSVVEHVEQHVSEHITLPTTTTTEVLGQGRVGMKAGLVSDSSLAPAHKKGGLKDMVKQEAGKVAREVKFEAEKLKGDLKEKREEKKMDRDSAGFRKMSDLENKKMARKEREAL